MPQSTSSLHFAKSHSASHVRWVFILTLFCSAGLLFLVQPMFGRMAMPILGGAPAVWNVAMMFFQTTLLAGYFYAHLLNKLPFRTQVVIHSGLLATALLALPIHLEASTLVPDSETPTLWLLGLMITTIGLPFFAISAQAPLMQRWFSRSNDRQAQDPYFLYSASNIGSVLGLLAYPAIMEPFFSVDTQASVWSIGFLLVLLLVLVSGFSILGIQKSTFPAVTEKPISIKIRTQLHWIVLAAVPSGLLLSVTNNITTDIAAMPLMWAPPLLAYLMSFVVAFAPPRWLSFETIRRFAPFFVIGLSLTGAITGILGIGGTVFLQVFFFFGVALACHATLVATRPDAQGLTQFYLLMSFGGAVGGAMVALLAPLLFNWIFEYPILIAVSALLLAVPEKTVSEIRLKRIIDGNHNAIVWDIVFVIMAIGIAASAFANDNGSYVTYTISTAGLFILCFIARKRHLRFAAVITVCSIVFGGFVKSSLSLDTKLLARSFFGVYRVGDDNNQMRLIVHGTTVHGAQSKLAAYKNEPQSYYLPESGIGLVMQTIERGNIGVVGLGSGALACYAKTEQNWSFYEIDPLVAEIAKNKSYFTYLSDCTPKAKIKIGDARLQLKSAVNNEYDVLVIDAFSSDSIPLHLITADAFSLYRAKMHKNGILMVHISNKYMDLKPVVGNIAKQQNWQAWSYFYKPPAGKKLKGRNSTPSNWIMLTPNQSVADKQFAQMKNGQTGWEKVIPDPAQAVWTDNYANTLSVLTWFK
jgi:hypothetical protein